MSLLDTIKSMLGIDRSSNEREGETSVSVEHEPSTESEEAVKGDIDQSTDTGRQATTLFDDEESAADGPEPAETAEPEQEDRSADAQETEAEPDVGAVEPAGDEELTAAEGEEPTTTEDEEPTAAGDEIDEPVMKPTDDSESTESVVDVESASDAAEAAEPSEAAESEQEDTSTGEPAAETEADAGTSVEEIKGIGPAYGERLAESGVETVADLAASDAEEIAEETDVPRSRVEDWIERAKESEE